MKRISKAFLILVALATTVWLTRNFKVVKVTPPAAEVTSTAAKSTLSPTNTRQQPQGFPDAVNAPESPRHSAGVIEQHQQTRLAALDEAVKRQEEKVEQRRKVLATILLTKGIIYKGEDSFYGDPVSDEAKAAQQLHNRLEQDKMRINSQIQSLLKYTGEQLMVYAAGLNLPDNTIKTGYPRYLEAKRELQSLQSSGLGSDHPDMKAATEQISTLKRELDEATVNLRTALQAQLSTTEDQSAKEAKNREKDIKRGLDTQEDMDAKRDFEADQQLLQELKFKQITEKLREAKQDGR